MTGHSGALSQPIGAVGLSMAGRVTDLVISGIGIPDYALRGVRQRVTPIEQSSRLERTVNGNLVDLSDPSFRKRATTITGEDVEFPHLADVWPGQEVTVTSIISASASGDPIVITGMVKTFEMDFDEYGAVASWTIEIWES